MCQPESVAVCDTTGFAEIIVAIDATTVMGLPKQLEVCMDGDFRKRLSSTKWKWKVNYIHENSLGEFIVNPCIS